MDDPAEEREGGPGCANEPRSWPSFFTGSAEKRAMLGPDAFLHTHVPVVLEREDGTRCNEEEVITRLLAPPEDPLENRVWFLVGQRGSGKTEVLEWLALELVQREPQRIPYILHIRSHETSLPHLLSKCKRLLECRERETYLFGYLPPIFSRNVTHQSLKVGERSLIRLSSDEKVPDPLPQIVESRRPHVLGR
ncbi:hypothetical protein KDI_49920 [Dictyobacter arantiisoli]|uniref:Uncharacterized protein n=1 Tax=Dictyobacter arantiisoli TaxID=2014874 RepID=A0A5A5TJL9_9CHLR|nr:hypothetical protein KDI_49920 [Dictyobacter arantiisoli]